MTLMQAAVISEPRGGICFRVAIVIAGLPLDPHPKNCQCAYYWALLDTAGQVSLATTEDKPVQNRLWPIKPAATHCLRLLVLNGIVDICVDYALAINYCLPKLSGGAVSLHRHGGACGFSDVKYQSVKPTRQTERNS